MLKSLFGFLLVACFLTPVAPAQDPGSYRTVYVPPPVGSHLGGGYVRVPIENQGSDETALVDTITKLNAAGGEKRERQFVIAAVSRSTGVSERELQAQQDILQLRFGDLCAINAIARGNSDKVSRSPSLGPRDHLDAIGQGQWRQYRDGCPDGPQCGPTDGELLFKLGGSRQWRPGQIEKLGIHPQPNVRPGG